MLEKNEISKRLYDYYKETYGELECDEWFEQTAVNVRVFSRNGKIITLKCHILSGEVGEMECFNCVRKNY